MAKFDFTIDLLGYRDVLGRFAKRTEAAATLNRELARESGRTMVRLLKHYAPRKTGLFAEGIYYRTYEIPGGVEARFYVKGKHAHVLPFLAYGTADHIIPTGGSAAQLAKGYPLHFYWQKGPRGPGEYSFWQVHHPGTNADPFIGYAKAAAENEISDMTAKRVRALVWL